MLKPEAANNNQVGICRFCGSPLYDSDIDGYTYQCLECDEDFYKFEQNERGQTEEVENINCPTNVEHWFDFEDSTSIEEQAKYFVAETVESYLNGCYDDPEVYIPEPLNKWVDYVWNTIAIEQCMLGENSPYKHLYFYGRYNMDNLTMFYLLNYEDVQPYIL